MPVMHVMCMNTEAESARFVVNGCHLIFGVSIHALHVLSQGCDKVKQHVHPLNRVHAGVIPQNGLHNLDSQLLCIQTDVMSASCTSVHDA